MGQHLNRLHRLHRSDNADQRRHHACFHAGQRILAKQAAQTAIARRAVRPGKDADLPLHADRRAGDQRHFMLKTAGVELVADRYIIGAVQHQIVRGNLREQRRFIKQRINGDILDMRVDTQQRFAGRVHFSATDIRIAVQRLALQV